MCSTVNGRCPEDPKDCVKDSTVTVTREPSNDDNDDLEEALQNIMRRENRRSRGSSRGVR